MGKVGRVWGKDEWTFKNRVSYNGFSGSWPSGKRTWVWEFIKVNYRRKQEVGKAEEVKLSFGASFEDPHEIVDMSDSSELAFFECGGPGFSCF